MMNIQETKFGWSYPAGAYNDPNAPWNEVEAEVLESEGYYCFTMELPNAKIESDEYDSDGKYCGDDVEEIIAYHPKQMIADLKMFLDNAIATETNKYRLRELKEKRSELEGIKFELVERELEKFPIEYDNWEEYED